MTPDGDAITRLVRSCEPREALSPDDPRYVKCDDVRGENLVDFYERSLRRADPGRPVVKLFAGHRGVGKTSELLRLKSTLQKQLKQPDIPGFSPTSTYLKRVWDDVRGLLGKELVLKEADVDVPFVSLAVELKNRPNARRQLRDAIERQSTDLLGAVNDLLTQAIVALRKADHEGLVLIIDGLDKLVRRPVDDGKTNTHDRLFLDRSEQLASLKTHVIYTVPISLIYSPRCAQLEQTFGEHNVPVPMIRLRPDDRADPAPETPGMQKMWEMIEARCQYANVDIADVFDDPGTGHYLCRMTGGHPRHLMMFLQASANAVDDLPITREAAEKAVNNYAISLLREVPDAFWPKLRGFAEPRNDIPKDEDHLQMLFLLHVFEYMDGIPWYEVNPVIRTLAKFNEGG